MTWFVWSSCWCFYHYPQTYYLQESPLSLPNTPHTPLPTPPLSTPPTTEEKKKAEFKKKQKNGKV